MNRVFVTQDNGRISFDAAKKWGEVIPLIDRGVYPDNAQDRSLKIAEVMQYKMATFDPQEDYLLLSGDPILIATAASTVRRLCPGKAFRCLKYDRDLQEYYVVNVY